MGKTICLLIALVFLAQAEYVKSLQPTLQSQEKTQKTTRNSRIPDNKNLSKAELNTSNAENSRTHIKPSKPQNSQNNPQKSITNTFETFNRLLSYHIYRY